MIDTDWTDNVRFVSFTPATIHYDFDLDAFYVARADLRSSDHRHRLGIVVAVTARDLTVNRITIQEAITWGRTMVERLIEAYRDVPDTLRATEIRIFDFSGERLR